MQQYYTPEQTAEKLAIKPRTVREWLRTGRLQGTKVSNLWRVSESQLESFLRSSS